MNILLPGLEVGTFYAVQVKPSGPENAGADWSPLFIFKTAEDTNPPPKPSTPILSNGLGTIIAEWDGNDSDGNRMYDVAPDTTAVEVHVSDASGFTPSPGTLSGHIMRIGDEGGKWVISKTLSSGIDLPYGADVFVKFVAIDLTNLSSLPSDEANAQFLRVSGLDIENGAIGPEKVSFDYGGVKTTASPTAPPVAPDVTPNNEGDLWINTSAGAAGTTLNRWDGSQWVLVPWAAGALGPGSVGATQLAAGAITAGSAVIGTGAIQSAQIGTAQVARANIATAAIDDARIANVAAGKITSDTLWASIILGGSIATASSGSRVSMNSSGLYFYNQSGQNTISMSTSTGSATFTGQFLGTLFKSTSPLTGGSAYVEMGQTGFQDPTDELRMWNGGRVSSIRNPSDRPGVARISAAEYGSSSVFNFGYYGLEVPGYIMSPGLTTSQTISLGSSAGIVLSPYGLSTGAGVGVQTRGSHVSVGGYSIGTSSCIKFLSGSNQCQIRNASDSDYGDMVVNNINFLSQTNRSDPVLKTKITELNVDPIEALSQVKLRAWDWLPEDEDTPPAEYLGGLGMLTTDLPGWMLNGDGYDVSTVLVTAIVAIQKLNERIESLEAQLTTT